MIYFIESPSLGMVKIGYSARDPNRRFAHIKVGSPAKMEKIGLMAGGREVESAIHIRFREHRSRGEWFRMAPEVREFIAENAGPWEDREPDAYLTPEEREADENQRSELERMTQYMDRFPEIRSLLAQGVMPDGIIERLGLPISRGTLCKVIERNGLRVEFLQPTYEPARSDGLVGSRIQAARESLGVDRRALAERLDVSYQRIADIEADRKPTSLERVIDIAAALGIDPHSLDHRLASLIPSRGRVKG